MEETCSECDFNESTTPPSSVATALVQLGGAIGATIHSIPADAIRRRPAPEVWSPLEYLGHLRESMAFHRWLIELALAEHNPNVPMVNPDESVADANYNDAATTDLIAQFDRRTQRLSALLVTLDDDSARRPLTLGARRITVALIARSAWHECHHHHGDIRRSLASTSALQRHGTADPDQ
ncbi:MAG: hypothetical protein QOJ80_4265 [Mycobacterium sp.]|nr:hypothetical protein [Mycobacterium sp.]